MHQVTPGVAELSGKECSTWAAAHANQFDVGTGWKYPRYAGHATNSHCELSINWSGCYREKMDGYEKNGAGKYCFEMWYWLNLEKDNVQNSKQETIRTLVQQRDLMKLLEILTLFSNFRCFTHLRLSCTCVRVIRKPRCIIMYIDTVNWWKKSAPYILRACGWRESVPKPKNKYSIYISM